MVAKLRRILRSHQLAPAQIAVGAFLLLADLARSSGVILVAAGLFQRLCLVLDRRIPERYRLALELFYSVAVVALLALGIATFIYARFVAKNTF